MEGPPRIRLTVHLDIASEPLSGTVGVEDEEERHFQGWIELANAIDRAHAARPADRSQTPDAAG